MSGEPARSSAVLTTARDAVRARYPDAVAAVLGAAATSPLHSASSDLDFVVIEPAAIPRWEGFLADPWPAEAFVASQNDWQRYVDAEIARRLPVVLHLTAGGIPLIESTTTRELQATARELYARGPRSPRDEELELARRLLVDLVDDLMVGAGGLEASLLIGTIGQRTAELALTAAGRWLGEGKWLARRLTEGDPRLAQQLREAISRAHAGDTADLIDVATRVINRLGQNNHVPWTHDVRPELDTGPDRA